MDNVIQFPTPREQAGVSMVEDMNGLLDGLMTALMALHHSENITESDREDDIETVSNIFVKYFDIAVEKYPEEFSAEGENYIKRVDIEEPDEE